MVNILAAEGIRRLDRAEKVKIFVGGLPQAPGAAAQLSDRVFAGGRARLLHHALVGASGWQAGAGRCPERGRAGRVSLAGRHAGGVSHRRRHQHAAVCLRGQDRRHGVQDAPLSRARRHHAPDPRAGPAGQRAHRGEGQEGGARGTCSSPRCTPGCTSRRAATWLRSRCR